MIIIDFTLQDYCIRALQRQGIVYTHLHTCTRSQKRRFIMGNDSLGYEGKDVPIICDLLFASWSTKKVSGIIQFKSKGLKIG